MRPDLFPMDFEAAVRPCANPMDGTIAEPLVRGWAAVELKSPRSRSFETMHSWLARGLSENGHFSFRDRWKVDGQVEDVAQTLLNTEAMSSWWPQLAFLKVAGAGHIDGSGRIFAAQASGFMPYKLTIAFRVVRVRFPEEFAVELKGDLCGHGGGRLRQDGTSVAIDFDLKVRVARPMLRVLSLLARPALCAQHRWVMRQGELGLRKKLESQHRMGADL
jgi:hypothetical protein